MRRPSGIGLRIFIFLMMGIILSGIATVMYLTKSINLEKFYDVGELYDIYGVDYQMSGDNWIYNYEKGLIETQAEDANCLYSVKHSRKNWGYLYLDIRDLSADTPARMDFLGEDGELLYTIEYRMQKGRNVLELQEDAIYSFRFTVHDPVSFAIKRIQFRERAQDFTWSQAPAVFAVASLCCFPIVFFMFVLWNHLTNRVRSFGGNLWTETLKKCYACILERCGALSYGLSERERSLLRRILFVSIMLLLYMSSSRGWTINIITQRRMVLALGVCFLCLAFLSWERTNRKIVWHNPLVSAWLVTWLMCMVSDFVVPKNLRYLGVLMLGAMGPFYLAWNSMKKPERLIRDILAALRWFYWGACVFCLFFSPLIPGMRYVGIYKNTNAFAGFLVTVNIAFLTWLDENLGRERLKKIVLMENVFGLVSIWGFLMLTESLTSLAAYTLQWIVFLWKQFPAEKKKVYHKNLRHVLFLSLISFVIVMTVGRWGISYVPDMMWTSPMMQEREMEPATGMSPFSLKVEAAEKLSERILRKITSGQWESLFTNRTEVWIPYIRNWNLFGHSEYQECINGVKMHAHNAVLQMMHFYGIFVVIPYLIMLYYSLKYGVMMIFNRKQMRLNLFFLLVSVNYVVQGLAEDIATPYAYMSWLMFYIALGGMFNQQLRKAET